MCKHSGKSMKDFCKMSDEQIIKDRCYGDFRMKKEELCYKKYGVKDEWAVLKRNGVVLGVNDAGVVDAWKKAHTKASVAKWEEINKWKDAHEEDIIKDLPCLIDHSVKTTADFYRMCSKVGSALVKIRNATPSKENYNIMAGIMELLASSQSKLATWDDVKMPRFKK